MPRKNKSPNLWTPLAKKSRRNTKPKKDAGPPKARPPRKPVERRMKNATSKARAGWN